MYRWCQAQETRYLTFENLVEPFDDAAQVEDPETNTKKQEVLRSLGGDIVQYRTLHYPRSVRREVAHVYGV